MKTILFLFIAISFFLRPFETHRNHNNEGVAGACCPHVIVRKEDEWCSCKEKP